MKKIILLITILVTGLYNNQFLQAACCPSSCATGSTGTRNPRTIFVPRSQSMNAARDLCGEQQYINQFDMCGKYIDAKTLRNHIDALNTNYCSLTKPTISQDTHIDASNSLDSDATLALQEQRPEMTIAVNAEQKLINSIIQAIHDKMAPLEQVKNNTQTAVDHQSDIEYVAQPPHMHGCFSLTAEYTRSFRPNNITDYFFGQAACNGCVNFSGSTVANRGTYDILADYFGLPQDFQSTVCFTPRIQNFILDFDLYLDLDCWAHNSFFRVIAPLVYTKWDLNPCENIINEGVAPFPLGYMAQDEVPRASLPTGVIQAMGGCVTWGDMQTPLQYGKIANHGRGLIRFSDIVLMLGWNFINNENAHMGFAIRSALPAGNAPKGEYLFEPIVGNCGHFELGLGFTSHLLLWQCAEQDKALNLYFDVNGTHLFSNKQIRTFDFVDNNFGSRYILAAKFQKIQPDPDGGNPPGHLANTGEHYEYAGSLLPAINLTAMCCDVSIALQADAVLKLAYTHKNFEFDLGYNFWGRTKEKVIIADEFTEDEFSLKGDAFMYGAAAPGCINNILTAQAAYAADVPNSRIPLAAMEDEIATLFVGGNYADDQNSPPQLNPGLDYSTETALACLTPNTLVYSPIPGIGDNATGIETSNPVNFTNDITELNLNCAISPSAITSKIFINASYNWHCDEQRAQPFICSGFEVEFDGKRKDIGCKTCEPRSGLSQWGLWVKGGVGF